MSSTNWFSNLKLDAWYKVFVLIGGIGFLFSLVWPIQTISNKQAMIFCLGILLIGAGEWKSQKFIARHYDASAFNAEQWVNYPVKKHDSISALFIILGIIGTISSFLDIIGIITIFND